MTRMKRANHSATDGHTDAGLCPSGFRPAPAGRGTTPSQSPHGLSGGFGAQRGCRWHSCARPRAQVSRRSRTKPPEPWQGRRRRRAGPREQWQESRRRCPGPVGDSRSAGIAAWATAGAPVLASVRQFWLQCALEPAARTEANPCASKPGWCRRGQPVRCRPWHATLCAEPSALRPARSGQRCRLVTLPRYT